MESTPCRYRIVCNNDMKTMIYVWRSERCYSCVSYISMMFASILGFIWRALFVRCFLFIFLRKSVLFQKYLLKLYAVIQRTYMENLKNCWAAKKLMALVYQRMKRWTHSLITPILRKDGKTGKIKTITQT